MQPVSKDGGSYRPFGKMYGTKIHCGHDYEIDYDSPVYSVAEGMVIHSQTHDSFQGDVIIIEHKNNTKHKFSALYGHVLSRVNVGDHVEKGAVIGFVCHYDIDGTDYPHLHFCIWEGGGRPPYPWGYVKDLGNFISPKFYLNYLVSS